MKRLTYIIAIILAFLLASCSTKNSTDPTDSTVSTEKKTPVEQIELGMSMEEVVEIMGKPDDDVGSGTVVSKYVLSDNEVAIVSYQIDSDGIFRVCQIYHGPEESVHAGMSRDDYNDIIPQENRFDYLRFSFYKGKFGAPVLVRFNAEHTAIENVKVFSRLGVDASTKSFKEIKKD